MYIYKYRYIYDICIIYDRCTTYTVQIFECRALLQWSKATESECPACQTQSASVTAWATSFMLRRSPCM